ncbi:outer membrane beta-barrel protein [Telmatospirillum siberiense]|nr:outer membrane beta-barrel protein [Telmatospirillum siberiense]
MRLIGIGVAAAIAVVLPVEFANAQVKAGLEAPEATTPERQSVLQRARPDYDPLGVRAGSFIILPSVDVEEAYNSNVYVTPNNTKEDFETVLRPAVAVNSDWNNHALSFLANGTIKRFAKEVSENNSDAGAFVNGRYDIERDVYFTGALSYQLLHEDRSSPDAVTTQKSPIEYQQGSAKFGFVREPGRLGFRLDAGADTYAYGNGVTSTGTRIIETDRNYTSYTITPRVRYEITPGYHAFVKASYNDRVYVNTPDTSGYNRNSTGYAVDAGTAVDLGRVLTGEVYVGYLSQDYDDSRLKSASGADYGASLLWNVTQITSLRLSAQRTVEETTLASTSGYLQTTVSPSIEHELMRNLLLNAGFSYVLQEFQGSSPSRTDDIYKTDAGLRYLINRNMSVGLTGSYGWRRSNALNTNYDQDIVLARLRLQL